jgi:hypothetical protein
MFYEILKRNINKLENDNFSNSRDIQTLDFFKNII